MSVCVCADQAPSQSYEGSSTVGDMRPLQALGSFCVIRWVRWAGGRHLALATQAVAAF